MNEDAMHGDQAASELVRLVGRDVLQKLQDRFSALAKVTVCICTVGGRPITKPTWGSPFSRMIGTSAMGREAFSTAIAACKPNTPVKDSPSCHDGLRLSATAIVNDGRPLATLIVATRSGEAPGRKTVERIAAKYGLDPDELWRGVSEIDPHRGGEPSSIRRFARVLADTIATLVSQAAQIRRQLADLRTVHELTELLSGTRDLQELLDLAVQRVVDVMSVKACAIRLLDSATGELVIKAVHNLSDEYLSKGPVILDQNAIDAATFAGEAVYIEDATTDSRIRYPQNARKEGIVSGLCVPMAYRGQTIGVLRVYTARRYRFSHSEESLLRSIASQATSAIITSRLHEQRADAERVQRQMEAAGEIQQRMLPSKPPQHARLDFGCVYVPTLLLGGDFFDFIELADGRIGFSIADVVGKGLPAAMLMSSVRSALRAFANEHDEVDQTIAKLNQHVNRDTLVGEFATLLYGIFSVDGSTFTCCNAGHVAPLLLRDGQFRELIAGGLVIGVLPDQAYEREVVELQSGDTLTMVTDGVTEAINFEDVAFGGERLLESIRRHESLDAQQMARQILWDVRRFVGLAEQSDDISIVVVKVNR